MEPHLPDFKTSLSPHISIPKNQKCTYSVMSNSVTLLPLTHHLIAILFFFKRMPNIQYEMQMLINDYSIVLSEPYEFHHEACHK